MKDDTNDNIKENRKKKNEDELNEKRKTNRGVLGQLIDNNKNISEQSLENNRNAIFESVDEILVVAQNVKENDNKFRDLCKDSDADVEMLNFVIYDLLSCYVRMNKVVSKDDIESLGVFYCVSRCLGLSMSRSVSSLLEFEKYDRACAFVEQKFATMPEKYSLKKIAYWVDDDNLKIKYLTSLRKYANNLAKFDDRIDWLESSCISEIESCKNQVEYRAKVKSYFKYGIADLHSDLLNVEIARYIVRKQRCTVNDIQIQFLLNQKDVLKCLKKLEDEGIIATMANGRKKVIVSTDEELQMIFLGEIVTEKEENVEQIETDILTEKNQSDPIEKLNSLIGLNSVKSEIISLKNFLKIQIERNKQGLKQTSISYHCVFTGNPGTGKTTVARILAEVYKNLGIIEKGHLVETDRSGLVAEYVGQTAVKTNKIIDSALDGVLFIDEAYSLIGGGDYGKEAIATLLKRMEDDRDRFVVILAGYTEEMQSFIDSNPGLQSRFSRYIEFPDYSAEELFKIFELKMKENEYTITDDAKIYLQTFFTDSVNNKDRNFGNGRFVRNVFEKVITRQSNRLASLPSLNSQILSEITIEDLKEN